MKPAVRVQKVVILNDRSEALGGATSLALLSARLLHAAGLKVVYVTGDSGARHGLPYGIRVVALGGLPLLDQPFARRVRDGFDNEAAFRLVRDVIAAEDGPDTVYHLHGWAQTLSPAVFRALAPVEERLVVSAHDFSLVCPNGSYFNFQTDTVCPLVPLSGACLATHCDKRKRAEKAFRVLRILRRQQLISLARTPALIAMIHPAMEDWITRAGADHGRLRVLRNPVTPFCATRVEAERNADLFFIGRLQPEKGAVLAAEAARAAGRRLRVIGEGPERDLLASRFPNVVLEGWRSHSEIAGLIREARALVMPSRLPEPFGLVALEALQSGVPLIAFADSFVAQEAAGTGAAFLAGERSPEALAGAVRQLGSDDVVAAASRAGFENCRAFASTPDSWRDQMIALYDEQLSRAPVLTGASP
ncbi:MAG: glycosyltransferase family 4 protein [Acidobacteria bacterium]|nr:glycosyltransferase family 4 protein [Acidobacteriota bacterium]